MSLTETVLLIDDDPDVLRAVGAFLDQAGYEVLQEETGGAGLDTFDRRHPDVVLLDLRLPDLGGLEVLERLRERDAAVVLLTGHGDVPTAVRAMQLGAENFLTKPVDMPHLVAAIERACEKQRLRREVQAHRARGEPPTIDGFLGGSIKMRQIERQVALVAESDRTTVLLTGESGTGKGRIARLIHEASSRSDGPFVDLNCGGFTAQLLGNELFGHDKGAFTDARERKQGLFELAHRGTLFLDEVGAMPAELQPTLLKVLETKRFRRLGGTREITVDIRLVAATNADLVEAVNTGAFREDLYYRLSVAVIHLPPVRERSREDRLTLVERLLAELAAELPNAPTELSGEALERLLGYPWPGNVREMRNALERAMIMARDAAAIGTEHLPADIRRGASGLRRHRPQTLKEGERQQVERALKAHDGNRTRAAKELGISRVTLLKKIRQYGLE